MDNLINSITSNIGFRHNANLVYGNSRNGSGTYIRTCYKSYIYGYT